MTRCLLLLALLSACSPKAPSSTEGERESGTSTSGAGTGVPTSGGETSTGEASTGAVTTGDASTGEPSECAWDSPENQSYCPLLAAPNIDLLAVTPMGPVVFKYAYFGMFLCAPCPEPGLPALGLFAEAQLPGLDPFVGDYLLVPIFKGGLAAQGYTEGRVGGQQIDLNSQEVTFPTLMAATQEQTTPPLDPDAPPTMSGSISVIADGWMLAGEFMVSLCTALDWSFLCEKFGTVPSPSRPHGLTKPDHSHSSGQAAVSTRRSSP